MSLINVGVGNGNAHGRQGRPVRVRDKSVDISGGEVIIFDRPDEEFILINMNRVDSGTRYTFVNTTGGNIYINTTVANPIFVADGIQTERILVYPRTCVEFLFVDNSLLYLCGKYSIQTST